MSINLRLKPGSVGVDSNQLDEKIISPFRKKPIIPQYVIHDDPHDYVVERSDSYMSSSHHPVLKKSYTQNSIGSAGSKESVAAIENLLNFLTSHEDSITTNAEILRSFESLTADVLGNTRDPEVYRLLRSNGWTGTRYRATDEVPLDVPSCIQSFSNWYLKQTRANDLPYIYDFFEKDSMLADQVFSFCPDTLLHILRNRTDALPASPPTGEGNNSFSFHGACMLADISGFTKFSSSMCRKGVRGLDNLREVTNGFLGYFVRIVYEHRGDVIAFAGDALICVFHDIGLSKGDNTCREDSCMRALQCAYILRNHETQNLSVHLALSYGEMNFSLLGGLHGQWVHLVNGACVSELSDCINDAKSKEVVCTSEYYQQALTTIKALSKGADTSSIIKVRPCGNSNNVLVELVDWYVSTEITAVDKTEKTQRTRESRSSRLLTSPDTRASKKIVSSASLFIPKPIMTAISTESLDLVGEFRQVTTMFLSLDSYSAVGNQDPSTLQPFFLIAQEVLYESGGFLRQFLVDDKGCVLIAMWGIPSFTYSNNCSRALYCAVSISVRAKEIGHVCSVGVTTGNVFCGIVGAPERRDYAGIGSDVNMAARLMSKAKERILVDECTYNNLSHSTRSLLVSAEEMHLKGKDRPIVPYKYSSESIPRIAAVDEHYGHHTLLNQDVAEKLSLQLESSCNGNTTFTVVVGPPGTNKSAAVSYFRRGAVKRLMQCVRIHAQRGHEGVPHGVMRELFLRLIGEDNFATPAQQKAVIDQLLGSIYSESEKDEIEAGRKSLCVLLGNEWSDNLSSLYKNQDPGIIEETDMSADNMSIPSEVPEKNQAANKASSMTTAATTSRSRSNSGANNSMDDVLNDNSSQNMGKKDDKVFFKVLKLLLMETPTAIIIEYAHYCDELSWEELNNILVGNLNVAVLISMENKFQVDKNNLFTPTPQTRKRQSVLSPVSPVSPRPLLETESPRGVSTSSLSASLGGGARQEAPPAAYASIVSNPNTNVIEMTSLNEEEVRNMLSSILNVTNISNDIVQLVLDVSSGNVYWCKMIANFIKERGTEELDTALEEGTGTENPLKVLILLRMEKLKPDHQLIIKYASIIGEEFSEKLLAAVLPKKLVAMMTQALKHLVEDGLITLIEEYPEAIYEFQNNLIKETFYNLMPPSDAAHIHLKVAEFIEVEYANKLRPLYPMLGHHYKKSTGKRHLAFKYHIKAADQAICRGAFNDGLKFVDTASNLAVSKLELRVLIAVVSRALDDLNPQVKTNSVKTRRISFNRSKTITNTIAAYMQLKINAEAAFGKVSKTSLEKGGTGEGGNALPAATNRIIVSRQPSAKLTWQPSYVASRSSEMEERSNKVKQQPKHPAGDKSSCAIC